MGGLSPEEIQARIDRWAAAEYSGMPWCDPVTDPSFHWERDYAAADSDPPQFSDYSDFEDDQVRYNRDVRDYIQNWGCVQCYKRYIEEWAYLLAGGERIEYYA